MASTQLLSVSVTRSPEMEYATHLTPGQKCGQHQQPLRGELKYSYRKSSPQSTLESRWSEERWASCVRGAWGQHAPDPGDRPFDVVICAFNGSGPPQPQVSDLSRE